MRTKMLRKEDTTHTPFCACPVRNFYAQGSSKLMVVSWRARLCLLLATTNYHDDLLF